MPPNTSEQPSFDAPQAWNSFTNLLGMEYKAPSSLVSNAKDIYNFGGKVRGGIRSLFSSSDK